MSLAPVDGWYTVVDFYDRIIMTNATSEVVELDYKSGSVGRRSLGGALLAALGLTWSWV